MSGLRQWLEGLQLEGYYESFVEQRIDLDVLPDLTEADLVDLGLPLGDRKRLMRGIAALGESRGLPARPPPSLAGDPLPAGPAQPLYEQDEELRQLTLLFADLVGSTALSKRLDLERYRDAIRTYQLCCSDVIRSHFGFVAQFLGDGVVAYFGYPTAEEDDAERAVSAGLAIAREVARLRADATTELAARVGVATGDVLISDLIGERLSIRGAVLGDTPNLAARLQALAEPGQVVISANTKRLLGSQFDCMLLGPREIKGFTEPVDVWLARGMEIGTSRFSSRRRGPMTPFVGRTEELELLRNRWRTIRQGEGRVVLISGEAGLGKSRLAELLSNDIASEPHYRLSYQCSPYHTGSALYPVMMQLAHAAGLAEGDSDDDKLDKLERLLAQGGRDPAPHTPLFARLLSIPFEHRYEPFDLTPEVIRERTVAALLDRLFALAEKQPVMMLFEDVHWIDPSTAEILDLLVDRMTDSRILLLCTYRPEYDSPWIGRAGVSQVSLSRLDARRSLDMVERLAAGEDLPPALVGQIVAKTEGVPLFIEELTKTVIERRQLQNGTLGNGLALPSTLKDLLMAKLDSLSSAREVVPLCAAIGRSFPYRLLLAVAGMPEHGLRPILDQLTHSQILLQRGEWPEVTFTFRHALIQDAAYDTMLASRARALHARIAEVVAERFPDLAATRPEVLAQHYARAAMPAEARNQWRRAAEQAIARSATVEAVAHLEAALAENAHLPEDEAAVEAEIEIRKTLCVPLEARYWGSGDITRNLERLGDLLRERGDEDDLFLVLHGLCGEHLISGDPARARAFAEHMQQIAAPHGEGVLAVLTEHNLGMSSFFLAEFERAIGHFDRAIALSPSATPEEVRRYYVADPRIVDMVMRAWALALVGRTAEAQATAAAVAEDAEASDHDFTRTYAFCILGSVRQALDDAPGALAAAERGLHLSQRISFRYWEAWSRIMRGWALAATGRASDGLKELTTGIDEYAATGSRQIVPYAKTLLAEAYLLAGQPAAGLALIEGVEVSAAETTVRFHRRLAERVGEALREAADRRE